MPVWLTDKWFAAQAFKLRQDPEKQDRDYRSPMTFSVSSVPVLIEREARQFASLSFFMSHPKQGSTRH